MKKVAYVGIDYHSEVLSVAVEGDKEPHQMMRLPMRTEGCGSASRSGRGASRSEAATNPRCVRVRLAAEAELQGL